MSNVVEPTKILELNEEFNSCRANRVARNSVTSSDVYAAARDLTKTHQYHDTYGVSLKAGEVTNQRQSGRCWLFAAYNVMRAETMKKLDVDSIEFSQAYGMFYDKLEKANTMLENIIATADRPANDREVMMILEDGVMDGGYYNYAMNLTAKWGVVPKEVMPETACSRNATQMNNMLGRITRKHAHTLRQMHAEGKSDEELRQAKTEMLKDVHQILCTCLGNPPAHFDFIVKVGEHASVDSSLVSTVEPTQSEDASKQERVLRDFNLTPQEFYKKYVGVDPEDYVALVNMPGKDRPFGTVWHLCATDNVEGGTPMRHINVEQDVLEQATIKSLKAGVPVWMACDVMQEFPRSVDDAKGYLTLDVLDLDSVFGLDLGMSREDMIDARESSLTHAMTFQGVELDSNEQPVAWRIENSWGKENCKEGYLICSADWFRLYGGEVNVRREFVPTDILKIWDEAEAVDVFPWDNIGAALSL